ncbi:MAG TPA: ferritin-like domain-containing protein [Thermoanaerobaculia bacterium]
MSIDPKGWTPDRVRQHLQNAVYLEMWTIPLYLTAAYSIAAPVSPSTSRPGFAPVPSKPDGSPDFGRFDQQDYNQYAFNSVLSVAIQEMLHVELAANLRNAVRPRKDVDPSRPWVRFSGDQAPSYDSLPPCLKAPLPPGVELKLGPMDLNQARLFQWIEEERDEPGDPREYRQQYISIGAFYTSLQYGAEACWPELYPPHGLGPAPTADELLQKDDWAAAAKAFESGFLRYFFFGPDMGTHANVVAAADRYPFSIQIYGAPGDALVRAEAALTAIKVQGEGAGSGEVPPKFVPSSGNPIEIALDRISHWQRFTEIVALVRDGRIQLIDERPDPILEDLQQALYESFSSFLVGLDRMFATPQGSLDDDAMEGLGNRTLDVWQHGGTPEYRWSDPGSAYDPTHARDLHACQGLNMCAGKGANDTGTQPGDGDCATAWFHTCGGTNMCAGQGGCGYAGNDPQGDWQPNFNSALGNGGCGAPIPQAQVFSSSAPANLRCQDVWAYARQLMREKVPGFPTDDPPANALRKVLSPTSTKARCQGS